MAEYGEDEVRALIEHYEEVCEVEGTTPRGLTFLVMRADLDSALGKLSFNAWKIVLLHGLLGIPGREVARLLHISQQAVSKRYRRALEDIHWHINGGDE